MRVKSGVYTRSRKKKIFRISKGYYSNRGNRWRQVIQQVDRSLRYAYRDRKDRKGDFRKLWILRVNAAVRTFGMSYSQFISGLKKANIALNRKMLAELAIHDSTALEQIVQKSKSALGLENPLPKEATS